MIISKLVTRLIERDMGGKLWNPKTRWSRKQILLAFVETAKGHVGVGEAWVSGGSAEVVRRAIEDDIAPLVVGQDAFHVEGMWATIFGSTENSGRRGVMGAALFAGSLHLAATLANCESVEYHMVHQWLFELAGPDAFALEDGHVRPPAGPGIGLQLHYDSLEDPRSTKGGRRKKRAAAAS